MLPEHPHAHSDSLPEGEVRYEDRNIVRVIALQVASFYELKRDMFPDATVLEDVFARAKSREMAIRIFDTLFTPTPQITRMIWEFKVGGRSPNRYILPGGGGLDLPNPTDEEIIQGGLMELKDETGHVSRNARLRKDCTRMYGFDMHKNGVTIKRRNTESLMVVYIPRGQSTQRRFVHNENIGVTQRFTLEQVTHLLHDEVHLSSPYPGSLIDNLSLNVENHQEYGVIVQHEDTLRTRTAIESEMWVYEAVMWKRLATALLRNQSAKIRRKFKAQEQALISTKDPRDIDTAKALLNGISALLPKIEQSYHISEHQKRKSKQQKHTQLLLQSGIPEHMVHKRLAFIHDIELAYKDAFHSQKKRPSGR